MTVVRCDYLTSYSNAFTFYSCLETADHGIFISCPGHCAVIKDTALGHICQIDVWRSVSVALVPSKFCSHVEFPNVHFWGQLFSTLLTPSKIHFEKKKNTMSFHFYADDSQIYLPLKRNDGRSLKMLLGCFSDNEAWTDLKFWNLDDSKTTAPKITPEHPWTFQYVQTIVINPDMKMKVKVVLK